MSENDWSSEGTRMAPPKRTIPLWVWGCGGGCALFLVVGVVLGFFVFRAVGKATDQEANWAAIGEVLPVVERPEGYMVLGSPWRFDGVRFWILQAEDQSHQAFLMHAQEGDQAQETRGEMLNDGAPGTELGELVVQGRALKVLRFDSRAAAKGDAGPMEEFFASMSDGQMANVDLSRPGSSELLLLMYQERGKDARVDDEELLELLSHFRLGGGAPAPVEAPAAEPAGDGEEQD